MLLNLRAFHRPQEIGEAAALLHQEESRTAPLAGGTELVGTRFDELEAVVDLSDLGLAYIRSRGGAIEIGAMTTLKALTTDPLIGTLAGGLLARAARLAAPATIRSAATIGGTLAGQRGGVEIPTALLALGAQITLARPATTVHAMAEFVTAREQLLPGAILTQITLPLLPHSRSGFARVSRSPADQAILCAATVASESGTVTALGGLATTARLLPPNMDASQAQDVLKDWPAQSDFRASAEYRRWVAPVLVRRALTEAMGGVQA